MADRLVVCNTFAGNQVPHKVAEWLVRLRVTVAIISEIGGTRHVLKKKGLVYVSPKDDPPDAAIWVRRRRWRRRIKFSYRRLSPFIERGGEKPKLWRDRHVVRIQFGKRVWYSVHGNAVIANSRGEWYNNKGAQAWKQAMHELKMMILNDLRQGYRVRVGGDFNQRPNREEPLNPAHMFRSLGMQFINVDVMYLAWHPERDIAVETRVGERVIGADAHRSLHARFMRPRKKRRK